MPNKSAKSQIKTDLRGLIRLLGGHLYSSPQVFIRELLQNACDAVIARRELEPEHIGSIRFALPSDSTHTTLTVEDDGIGLTSQEIHNFLSTIGASSKLRQIERHRTQFIGQFGIGILSCFMVCDELVIVTRSATKGSARYEWRADADGRYAIRPLRNPGQPGTSVFIRLRPELAREYSGDRILRLLKQYGQMLTIPITFLRGERTTKVNAKYRPWDPRASESASDRRLDEYCKESFAFLPLAKIELSDPAIGLQGVGFIAPTPQARSWGGSHQLFLRNMFVCSDCDDLIPEWAQFIRFVLNFENLRPTASREMFQRGKDLERARDAIGEAVRSHLSQLGRKNRKLLDRIIDTHDLNIRQMAVENDDFFAFVIDMLKFETTTGRQSFGPFRQEHFRIAVAPTLEHYRQLSPIAASNGVTIFNGSYVYHLELLEKAVSLFPELHLQIVTGADFCDTLDDLSEHERQGVHEFLNLADEILSPFHCRVELRRFNPVEIVAFYANDLHAAERRALRETRANVLGPWETILKSISPATNDSELARLCLNIASPLIVELIRINDLSLQRTILRLLYVVSLLQSHQPMSASEHQTFSENLLELMARILGQNRS